MAAVLSFVTYSLAGNNLDTAKIFASMQLFNIIRVPIQGLPRAISKIADAHVALARLSRFLIAEDCMQEAAVNRLQEYAVEPTGSFVYETTSLPKLQKKRANCRTSPSSNDTQQEREETSRAKGTLTAVPSISEPFNEAQHFEQTPFQLEEINLRIPKGSFVCVFGRIGSGKSALLQALIGEMRKTQGHVSFSGSTSLVTQTLWIQSATVKDNILFGKDHDDTSMKAVIEACALDEDLEALPDGLETEIGGKPGQDDHGLSCLIRTSLVTGRGINLSGGQRSRVALARAAYFDADIIFMDDPLSAVDSQGK